MQETLTTPTPHFHVRVGTFPGNSVAFVREGVVHGAEGAAITIDNGASRDRIYRSGAMVSDDTLLHGRVEARIKAARGSGLVTGFFLYRTSPRQEIDIEITGNDPGRMLVNVYFNPGDEGAAFDFGYRGSPCRVDLGFDASLNFHTYLIEWHPDRISWYVDGALVHERGSWDPTPIPHLPMKLHANLWSPRSSGLAGRLEGSSIPSTAVFRDVAVLRFKDSQTGRHLSS
jgi:beta-glucanase (GH16 family)